MRLRLSIFAAVFLIVGLISISVPEYGYSQENISLGCCISPENGGTCEGCFEGGSGCAIDGSLCPETSDFTLDEVCSVSSVAGAICQAVQSSAGCCINSENTCENDALSSKRKCTTWEDNLGGYGKEIQSTENR